MALRNHNQELVTRFIRGARESMNKNNKKFDGFEEQGCHRGHWDRGGHHRHWRLRMAQDLVADVAEAEIEITAEAAVGKG